MVAVSSVRHNTELNKLFRDKLSAGKSKVANSGCFSKLSLKKRGFNNYC